MDPVVPPPFSGEPPALPIPYTPSHPSLPVPVPPGLGDVHLVTGATSLPSFTVDLLPTPPSSFFDATANGSVTRAALECLGEFFSHSFTTPSSSPDSAVPRELWFHVAANIILQIHGGMCRSCMTFNPELPNDTHPLPHPSPELETSVAATAAGTHTINSFFSSFITDPAHWSLCMRCLENCNTASVEQRFQAALMTCGHDIQVAHTSVFNAAHRDLSQLADRWITDQLTEIKAALIGHVLGLPSDTSHPELNSWISDMAQHISDRVIPSLAEEERRTTIASLTRESLDDARAQVTALHKDEFARLQAQASRELSEEYEDYRASLRQQMDADFLAYKQQLRIEAQEAKETARIAAVQALPPPPKSAAKSSRKTHHVDPLARPPSRAQSTHPSPNRTPQASPICPPDEPPALFLPGPGIPLASPDQTSIVQPIRPLTPAPLPTDLPVPPLAPPTVPGLSKLMAHLSSLSSKVKNLDSRVEALEGYPDFGPNFEMDYGDPPQTAVLPLPQPTGWDDPSPPPVAHIDDHSFPPLPLAPAPLTSTTVPPPALSVAPWPPPPEVDDAYSPTGPWISAVHGRRKGKGKQAATQRSNTRQPSPPVPSSQSPPPSSILTKEDLLKMSRAQLLAAYHAKWGKKLTNTNLTIPAIVNLYLTKPLTQKSQPTKAPSPSLTTDYLLIRTSPVLLQEPKRGNQGTITQDLQRAIRQSTVPSNGVSLLAGRWQGPNSHNFVLTFASSPPMEAIFRLRKILTDPFPPCLLAPQKGSVRVLLNAVPIIRDENGNLPSEQDIRQELESNPVCSGITFLAAPRWLKKDIDFFARHSSVLLSLVDPNGKTVPSLIRSPPALFGQ
jgi:hypothetical protein